MYMTIYLNCHIHYYLFHFKTVSIYTITFFSRGTTYYYNNNNYHHNDNYNNTAYHNHTHNPFIIINHPSASPSYQTTSITTADLFADSLLPGGDLKATEAEDHNYREAHNKIVRKASTTQSDGQRFTRCRHKPRSPYNCSQSSERKSS